MQELENILEEIKEMLEDNKVFDLNSDGTLDKCIIDVQLAWNDIKDIIRKHMNDLSADTKKANEILDKISFFGGQGAGRELWNDKPRAVQDEDIANFNRDVEWLKDFICRMNDGWIPVGERLPEEGQEVWVSTKTECVRRGTYTKNFGDRRLEGFICSDGFMWMNTANAWKQYVVPEPYRPERSE